MVLRNAGALHVLQFGLSLKLEVPHSALFEPLLLNRRPSSTWRQDAPKTEEDYVPQRPNG